MACLQAALSSPVFAGLFKASEFLEGLAGAPGNRRSGFTHTQAVWLSTPRVGCSGPGHARAFLETTAPFLSAYPWPSTAKAGMSAVRNSKSAPHLCDGPKTRRPFFFSGALARQECSARWRCIPGGQRVCPSAAPGVPGHLRKPAPSPPGERSSQSEDGSPKRSSTTRTFG